ncbi:hypothetical protein AVEN_27821-1 [Araneus ventricosus]|uniref:Uncharacterized protein n=1 Tax=Araneus ventricosus TaxID=182803 RepID=A0A4Y2GP31_ARAVE|nr:hypothetical protein AVEN_27821-1 [Araneus ventricosus]
MTHCLTPLSGVKASVAEQYIPFSEILFSNGFRDYHFWTLLHQKGVSDNESYAFHMPQAVIDELSQVLEKRKPSLDKKTPMQAS